MKYIVVIFLILATCRSTQINQDMVYINEISRKYISKLIDNNKTVSDNIILDVEGKYWSSELTYTHLSMIKNFKAKKESDIVDFYKIFNTEDMYDLNKNQRFQKWSEIFPDLDFNKKEGSDIVISLPILSKGKNFAIFYVGTRYSGELRVYKKYADEWKYFANGILWIS